MSEQHKIGLGRPGTKRSTGRDSTPSTALRAANARILRDFIWSPQRDVADPVLSRSAPNGACPQPLKKRLF